MENAIHIWMGGQDDGRCPSVQQYDAMSRVYICQLWRSPNEPYLMADNAIVGAVFDWRGAPPSHVYETEALDRSTVRVTVPAAAMQKAGPVNMQLVIYENGGALHSPIICFEARRSLKEADTETDEPAMLLVALTVQTQELFDRAGKIIEDANNAAANAAEEANKWATAEINATALSAESQPTVEVTETDGKRVISFGIPAGKTPNITFKVTTGEPGTQVQIQQSGTSEAPVIELTIPRGDTGAVEGIDYYTGNPSALGAASPGTTDAVARGDHAHPVPTAKEVGALSANGTAANAAKLGGLPASDYALKNGTMPNPKSLIFTGAVSRTYNGESEVEVPIPSIPGTLPNPKSLIFTGAVSRTYNGESEIEVPIPTIPGTLPNPKSLIFTGAVSRTYNGESEVEVPIPTVTPESIGAVTMKTAAVTLPVASWSSNKQTVSVNGVTASNTVIVTSAPSSYEHYNACAVRCSAQAAGKLTFTCTDTPTAALTANVLILT